jgi:hypothetical protein
VRAYAVVVAIAQRIADSSSANAVNFFIRRRNETLSIIAVRIGNERRSPATIHGCKTAPTPTGFTLAC